MTFGTLITRGLGYFWRTHLGVVLGAAVGSAVLIGALAVGDSVRQSLRTQALQRLGQTTDAVHMFDRFFREELTAELSDAQSGKPADVIPVLQIAATASNRQNKLRATNVQLHGVTKDFWSFASPERDQLNKLPGAIPLTGVIINERLAEHLQIKIGDDVLIRIAKPSVLPRDAPLSVAEDLSASMNLTVVNIVNDQQMGNFNLRPDPTVPFNAFVDLTSLQDKAQLLGKVNMALSRSDSQTLAARLDKNWQLGDVELELRLLIDQRVIELRSGRIFIDSNIIDAVTDAAKTLSPEDQTPVQLLTYFVNGITNKKTGAETPYSMVAAMGPASGASGDATGGISVSGGGGVASPVPPDMRDDQIIITQWLADDLQIGLKEKLILRYFVLGDSRELLERSSEFEVAGIVPTEGPGGDRELMPGFPGLDKVDKVRNWKPGIPVDLNKIKKEDEEYWDMYRGTPKAFVTLAAGRMLWATERFGNATAVRFAYSADGRAKIASAFKKHFHPRDIGLSFEPVRLNALQSSRGASDFGMLFLSLSIFLVVSALILMGLLFVFGVEHRAGQIGTLMALGFTGKQVRQLMLTEGAALALLGTLIGTGGGLLYTKLLVYGLSNPELWGGALGATHITFHVTPETIGIGMVASLGVALATIWISVRRLAKTKPVDLLNSGAARAAIAPSQKSAHRRPRISFIIAGLSLAAAVALLVMFAGKQGQAAAGGFFGAGSLLLIAGLALCHALLVKLSRSTGGVWNSIGQLGLRGSSRRRGRSLATICLLACGIFLVIAVGAFRIDPMENALQPESGTGGYALIGSSTIPLYDDPNTPKGRDRYNLEPEDMDGVTIVPMRQKLGDDASCLNLNQAIAPTLLGVKPQHLSGRFTFTKTIVMPSGDPWDLLDEFPADGTVPAIGDMNTLMWGLHVGVGDTIPKAADKFYTDESGRKFKVKIVGMLANSILQGPLLISEKNFIKRFPTISGYKRVLVDIKNSQQLVDYEQRATVENAYNISLDITPVRGQPINLTVDGELRADIDTVTAGRTLAFMTVAENSMEGRSVSGRVKVSYKVHKADYVRFNLSTLMSKQGLELTSATGRLAEFSKVQNTYLDIFTALGGLGLLLGSVGLGVVVLRNILERRGELALLRAIGFTHGALRWLLLSEHWLLLILGLACGVVAAIVAVLPMLTTSGSRVPYVSMTLTAGVIVVSGLLWTYLAAYFALRGSLIGALRQE